MIIQGDILKSFSKVVYKNKISINSSFDNKSYIRNEVNIIVDIVLLDALKKYNLATIGSNSSIIKYLNIVDEVFFIKGVIFTKKTNNDVIKIGVSSRKYE